MGIHVALTIDAAAIEPSAWHELYRLARELLMAHPAGLLSEHHERRHGLTRRILSRRIEHEVDDPAHRHLSVCGDLESLMTAESLRLYADIGHYRTTEQRCDHRNLLHRMLDEAPGLVSIAVKTQGFPYHVAVLAIAMLAESRLPGRALVSGDIDPMVCREAADLLARQLDIRATLPLLVDAERLYDQLIGETPTGDAIDLYLRTVASEADGLRVLWARVSRDRMVGWLARHVARRCRHTGPELTRTLQSWLEVTQDLAGLIQALALRRDGPCWGRLRLASALVSTGVTLAPRRITGLARLDRPETLPLSVFSQVGNDMLDRLGMSARTCRYRLGIEPVIACLEASLDDPDHTGRAIIEQETALLARRLHALGTWAIRVSLELEREEADGDAGSLLRHRAAEPISPSEARLLQRCGTGLARLWRDWQVASASAHGLHARDRRRRVIQVVEHRDLVLTERAWGWIDAEGDQRMLDLLLLLLTQDDQQALLSTEITRAICEHRELCQRLLSDVLAQVAADDVMSGRSFRH